MKRPIAWFIPMLLMAASVQAEGYFCTPKGATGFVPSNTDGRWHPVTLKLTRALALENHHGWKGRFIGGGPSAPCQADEHFIRCEIVDGPDGPPLHFVLDTNSRRYQAIQHAGYIGAEGGAQSEPFIEIGTCSGPER